MTACCCYTGVKSSVYNQTGEGYFKQLAAYNHMSAHLRRVLLAKSRVDSRNPNYLRRRTMSAGRAKFAEKMVSQDFIDQLAYDTEHHPMELLNRMRCNLDSQSHDRSRKCPVSCNNFSIDCSGTNPDTIRLMESDRSRSISRSRPRVTGLSFHSSRPGSFKKNYFNNENERDEIFSHHDDSLHSSPRSAKSKDHDIDDNYASSFESASEISRRSSIVTKGSASRQSYTKSISPMKNKELEENSPTKLPEDAKYSKFLYDITQEIVQNGLYKDEELKEVFKKHIKRNSHTLDKQKMMYELYLLKMSLNLIDHEDDEEEDTIDRFLQSRRYSSSSPIKPPTPPKVLDENKIVDKLMNPEELKAAYSKSPHSGRHTVVLVDANPELLVTERDILSTLIEMNIDPQQAHGVYKRLQSRSRDLHTLKMKNRLDYVVFRQRTIGQVREISADTNFSPISSRQRMMSLPRKLKGNGHVHYPDIKDKEFNIDHTCLEAENCLSRIPAYTDRGYQNFYDESFNFEKFICNSQCRKRLPVKLLHCPGASPSHLSIKPKPSKEKKVMDVDKKVKSSEITSPKCFCSTKVTPKKNLLGLSHTKRDADMRNTSRDKKYVEIVKVKADDKMQAKKINGLNKSKVKSFKLVDSSSKRINKSVEKNLVKKEVDRADNKSVNELSEKVSDNASSSRSSQVSVIDRKVDSEKPVASYKLSPDIKKSSSTNIKSSVMKDLDKSPKVLKEIKLQTSDESEDESIVESSTDSESIAEETSIHFNREVTGDTDEKSTSKLNSISDNDVDEENDDSGDGDSDEIAEELDNVNENVDS